MSVNTNDWVPTHARPTAFLPATVAPETVFEPPPFEVSEFVRRALGMLASDRWIRAAGKEFDRTRLLPCKWKCADESLFSVDLVLHACTGQFPFDKGKLGGRFNPESLPAAFHHGPYHLDLGGSHVGVVEDGTGHLEVGYVTRPLQGTRSTDCGWLMQVLAPFKRVHDQACESILLARTDDTLRLTVPNEYLHPGWSTSPVKLLLNLDALGAHRAETSSGDRTRRRQEPLNSSRTSTAGPHATAGPVAGCTTFAIPPDFVERLSNRQRLRLEAGEVVPVGQGLRPHDFHLYSTETVTDRDGLPVDRLLLYVKEIVAGGRAPYPLTGALINACIEYNALTDALRQDAFRPYGAASFTGVFIDRYDEALGTYVNFFAPVAFSLKIPGAREIIELNAAELRNELLEVRPADPARPLTAVLGYDPTRAIPPRFDFPRSHHQDL